MNLENVRKYISKKESFDVVFDGMCLFFIYDKKKESYCVKTGICNQKFYLSLSIRQFCSLYNCFSEKVFFQYDPNTASIWLCSSLNKENHFQLKNFLKKFLQKAKKWSIVLAEINRYEQSSRVKFLEKQNDIRFMDGSCHPLQ